MKYRLRIPFISRDGGWPIYQPPPPSPQDRMFKMVNDLRAEYGREPFARHAILDRVAQRRAELALSDWEATGIFRHDNLSVEGDRYWEILPTEGISNYAWAGENLANNNFPDPVAEAMRGLQNSPTHFANMMETSFTNIGIGYVFRSPSGISMFAQIFLS